MTKLLITCVAENNPEFHFRVITLFKTLQKFGGSLATAKLIANFVNNIDPKIYIQLKNMGVSVRIVKPYDKRLQRHCNKIRMLEIDEEYDVLIALDCDTAVTRDFSSEISTNNIRRCDSLLDPLKIHQWEYLYNYFNLAMPLSENEIHANSAILFIPQKYVKDLRDAWLYYSYMVNDCFYSNDNWKEIGHHKYFTDQFALSLALAHQRINVELLPAEFNIHINDSYSNWANHLHPYILSYHHNVTENWKLKTTGMIVPDQYIKRVNSIL